MAHLGGRDLRRRNNSHCPAIFRRCTLACVGAPAGDAAVKCSCRRRPASAKHRHSPISSAHPSVHATTRHHGRRREEPHPPPRRPAQDDGASAASSASTLIAGVQLPHHLLTTRERPSTRRRWARCSSRWRRAAARRCPPRATAGAQHTLPLITIAAEAVLRRKASRHVELVGARRSGARVRRLRRAVVVGCRRRRVVVVDAAVGRRPVELAMREAGAQYPPTAARAHRSRRRRRRAPRPSPARRASARGRAVGAAAAPVARHRQARAEHEAEAASLRRTCEQQLDRRRRPPLRAQRVTVRQQEPVRAAARGQPQRRGAHAHLGAPSTSTAHPPRQLNTSCGAPKSSAATRPSPPRPSRRPVRGPARTRPRRADEQRRWRRSGAATQDARRGGAGGGGDGDERLASSNSRCRAERDCEAARHARAP